MAALWPTEPWTHRADHALVGRRPVDLPGAKLTAPIGVQDAAGDVTAAGDSHLDRCDDEAGLHPRVDGPAGITGDSYRMRTHRARARKLIEGGSAAS
jgi:hypothetical protein